VNRLAEDVIVEFLPPGAKGGMNYGCGHKRTCVDSGTTHIMEDPAALHTLFDFLSGLEEFMQEQSWGHLTTPNLPGHYVGLIIFISARIQPSSIEFSRQHTWADYDVENFQESPILTTRLKGEFNRESQCIIIQIGEPERILETFEEQFEKMANVLLNENS
jgi:hypothetical protein